MINTQNECRLLCVAKWCSKYHTMECNGNGRILFIYRSAAVWRYGALLHHQAAGIFHQGPGVDSIFVKAEISNPPRDDGR